MTARILIRLRNFSSILPSFENVEEVTVTTYERERLHNGEDNHPALVVKVR